MSYRVFLVEDEMITREGIRDNVDWQSAGFEFCGEASDGELALPLIEKTKPDVLITDIKMPFMDGLQLSKIIREHMPWVKIIILSGHNEFEYAQSAVKLGVTEYLLKPVSSKDIHSVLEGLSALLDQEKQSREKLKILQTEEDNLVLGREKLLQKLVMGGISSVEAIEQSQYFGLDIVAEYYLVVLIRIELCQESQPFDYYEYQQVEKIVAEFCGNNSDVFLTKKDVEELVLLIKGDHLEQLVQEGEFLAGLIKIEVEKQTDCHVVIEIGSAQNRLGNIHHSFAEALVKSKSFETTSLTSQVDIEGIRLIKTKHETIENYLKFGSFQEFDAFFAAAIEPVAEIALQSDLIKHYLFLDIILSVTQFVSDMGSSTDPFASGVHEIENILDNAKSLDQIKAELKQIFDTAISMRSAQARPERFLILQQARGYLEAHFSDPELKMSAIAEMYNISPGHFSTIFRQEFGETFRDYLSKLRLNHAKELLSSSNMQCSEVAYQCGYNDPHYFSFVFKKNNGVTPQQFRAKTKDIVK